MLMFGSTFIKKQFVEPTLAIAFATQGSNWVSSILFIRYYF